MNRNNRKAQEGFVLVIVAGILIVLIGFVALGVDTGVLYSARTSAQQVADAAALAGAFTYINNPTAVDKAATASDAATQVAINNSILGKAIVAADVTVTPDVANRKVKVVVVSAQPTYFAKAIWGNTANISVTAIAEAADTATGSSCVKPWFVPNSVLGSGTDSCAACAAGQLLIDPATGETTSFGDSQIGSQFVIKPNGSGDALRPGDYYEIDLPDSSGGNDYRTNIETCSNAYVRCQEYYSILTGKKTGPTMQGVNTLVGDPPRYVWQSPAHYKKVADGKIYDMSENVVVAPIWDTCGYPGFCPGNQFPGGTTPSVKVIGYALLFLEGTSGGGGDVTARLINVAPCGPAAGGGGGTGETGGTVLSFPLRLVRVP
jgi:Flp pilus assembly protein TadG